MGLFDRNRLPKWAAMIHEPLRPSADQITDLELVRSKADVSHEEFEMFLTGHPWTTHRLVSAQCEQLTQQYPSEPLTEVFATILVQRVAGGEHAYGLTMAFGPDAALEQARQLVTAFKTIESFASWVADREDRFGDTIPCEPGYEWVLDRVDEILFTEHP